MPLGSRVLLRCGDFSFGRLPSTVLGIGWGPYALKRVGYSRVVGLTVFSWEVLSPILVHGRRQVSLSYGPGFPPPRLRVVRGGSTDPTCWVGGRLCVRAGGGRCQVPGVIPGLDGGRSLRYLDGMYRIQCQTAGEGWGGGKSVGSSCCGRVRAWNAVLLRLCLPLGNVWLLGWVMLEPQGVRHGARDSQYAG